MSIYTSANNLKKATKEQTEKELEKLPEEIREYVSEKKDLEHEVCAKTTINYVDGLTHEQVVEKIQQLTTANYVTRTKMSELEKEIKECEAILNVVATPENIVAYKKKLDKSMRTSLKTITLAEEALLEEVKDQPDDVRRKWLEDIIQDKLVDDPQVEYVKNKN